MRAASKPIVFLLGPSGSGKTKLAEWVAKDLQFLHLEIDCWPRGDGIDIAGLRQEWDAYLQTGEALHLAATITKIVDKDQKHGAILSFPSTLILPTPLMKAAVAAMRTLVGRNTRNTG